MTGIIAITHIESVHILALLRPIFLLIIAQRYKFSLNYTTLEPLKW